MYKVSAAINNVEMIDAPLSGDFNLMCDSVIKAGSGSGGGKSKILFICTPNNPTGNSLKREDVLYLVENFPGMVVVDEAYVDFCEEESFCTLTGLYENLVVLQTFSKSFGLAGLRLGVAFGNEFVIDMLNRTKAPYNISDVTSQIGIQAMENVAVMEDKVRDTIKERNRVVKELENGLSECVVKVHPSDANFVLVEMKKNAEKIYSTMAEEGVVIRFRGKERHCRECLRITIGTREHNNEMIRLLKDVAGRDL